MIDYTLYIEVNPSVMLGKPCIKGTRITVEQIVEELAAGTSIDELLDSHSSLHRNAMLAALAFAADALKGEKTYPIAV